LSFPFFFDPGWNADIGRVPGIAADPAVSSRPRWDGADIAALSGTYGEYLLDKVSKVFPDLGSEVL
jgi:hypothetical protein